MLTGGAGLGAAGGVVPALFPEVAGVEDVVAADGALAAAALPALVLAGAATERSAGAVTGRSAVAATGRSGGAEAQAPSSNKTPASAQALVERDIDILRQFGFAIACGFQLSKHLEALLHPFVVNAVLGAHRVDLVRLDGLLLEGENLLLQQRVIFLELLALEVFWDAPSS